MDGVPVNEISKTLKGATFPGPRWQKGFFDHGIRAERMSRSGSMFETIQCAPD